MRYVIRSWEELEELSTDFNEGDTISFIVDGREIETQVDANVAIAVSIEESGS